MIERITTCLANSKKSANFWIPLKPQLVIVSVHSRFFIPTWSRLVKTVRAHFYTAPNGHVEFFSQGTKSKFCSQPSQENHNFKKKLTGKLVLHRSETAAPCGFFVSIKNFRGNDCGEFWFGFLFRYEESHSKVYRQSITK